MRFIKKTSFLKARSSVLTKDADVIAAAADAAVPLRVS